MILIITILNTNKLIQIHTNIKNADFYSINLLEKLILSIEKHLGPIVINLQ